MKVIEILRVKGNALFTVRPDSLLQEAVATMVEEDIGSLIVFEQGRLVGLLTFREVLKAVHRAGADWPRVSVRDAMLVDPLSVPPDMDVDVLRQLMVQRHQRYYPVLEQGTLIGVLSFHDVARAVLEEQGFENRVLKEFIRSMQDNPS